MKNKMPSREEMEAEAWDKERRRLEEGVRSAVDELLTFSGAAECTMPFDGFEVTIKRVKPKTN